MDEVSPLSGFAPESAVPTIADFFQIKRGIATGDNGYFILSAEEIEARGLPMECFPAILPSPRYVNADEIEADAAGDPILSAACFFSIRACRTGNQEALSDPVDLP